MLRCIIIRTETNPSRLELLKEIAKLVDKVTRARELFLAGDINALDYRIVKAENGYKIEVLEAKLSEITSCEKRIKSIKPKLKKQLTGLPG